MPSLLQSILAEKTEQREFAYLAHMLGGWFGQDYDLISEDFRAIVREYRESVPADEVVKTAEDIERFVARYGESEGGLRAAMDRVFYPCIIVEAWGGLTTREWLVTVAKLLRG